MRKAIVAIVTLVIIVVVGYLLIPVQAGRKNHNYSIALNAVPQKAVYIIRAKNPIKKINEFQNSIIGNNLSNLQLFRDFKDLLVAVDSVKNSNVKPFSKPLFLAGVLTAGSGIQNIAAVEVTVDAGSDEINKFFKSVFESDPTGTKNYEKAIISTYSKNEREFYTSLSNGVLLMASSSILLEEAIRNQTAQQHLPDDAGFKRLLKTADVNSDGSLFINYKQIGGFLELFTNEKLQVKRQLKNFGGWAEVDLNMRDKSIMLNGFSIVNDSIFTFLNVFQNQTASNLGVTSVLPENIGALSYFSFSDFPSYKKSFSKYLDQQQTLYKHQKNILNINKKHSFTVESDFYGWIGDEMATFTLSGDEGVYKKNTALILKVNDEEALLDGLKAIHSSTGVNSETVYQNFKINDLGLTNFFQLTLGDFFKSVTSSKYLILEDYIIFANDVSALKHIVNFYLRGKTLVKNISFNSFYKQFATNSNVFFYINPNQSTNWIANTLKSKSYEEYKTKKDSVNKLQAFGLQINSHTDLLYTNAFFNYAEQEAMQNVSLIEVKLDTSYTQEPWLVKNHYTNDKEILLQDDANNLYLINNVGKIIWKKPLEEKIIGDVVQIDRYKNKKLQYIFVTKNTLQQIDRNGKNVSGYPVALKAKVTQGITVLDYDRNRDYRILVTQGRNINNFSIDGKIVNGWAFKADDIIVTQPELLQVKKKDYIVFAQGNGKVRALNRRGDDRLKLNTTLPIGGRQCFTWLNGSLNNSGVFGLDTNGTVYLVKLNDNLETFALKSFSSEMIINYADFNGDNTIDFITLDEGEIAVFNMSKNVLAKINDFDFKPAYGTQSFPLEKGAVSLIVNKEKGKIFAYDKTGALLSGFPIDGVSKPFVADLDGNKMPDLIIGDKLGSLYIYALSK